MTHDEAKAKALGRWPGAEASYLAFTGSWYIYAPDSSHPRGCAHDEPGAWLDAAELCDQLEAERALEEAKAKVLAVWPRAKAWQRSPEQPWYIVADPRSHCALAIDDDLDRAWTRAADAAEYVRPGQPLTS